MDPDHIRAHKHSFRNREEVLNSGTCGCFYCWATFRPREITEWTDGEQTAHCPICIIDSVIGSASGFSIGKPLLKAIEEDWFSTKPLPKQPNG